MASKNPKTKDRGKESLPVKAGKKSPRGTFNGTPYAARKLKEQKMLDWINRRGGLSGLSHEDKYHVINAGYGNLLK